MKKVALSILLIAVIAVAAFYVMRPQRPESPPEHLESVTTPAVEPSAAPQPEQQVESGEPVVEPEEVQQPVAPPVEEGVSISARATDANHLVRPPGAISGMVMNAATRAGLSGFQIQLMELLPRRKGEPKPTQSHWTWRLGSRVGEFILEGIGTGKARLLVTAPGYVPREAYGIVVEPGRVTSGITVYLSRAATIEGYVTRNGLSIGEGARVIAYLAGHEHVAEALRCESRTGVDGFYRLEPLLPDTYTVIVEVSTREGQVATTASAGFRVAGGQVVRQDLEVGGSAAIRGKVSYPKGCAEVGVIVRAASATEPFSLENRSLILIQSLGWTVCAPDGSYEIPDVPPGSYNVTAFCGLSGGEATDLLQKSQTVTLRDGQTLELDFAL